MTTPSSQIASTNPVHYRHRLQIHRQINSLSITPTSLRRNWKYDTQTSQIFSLIQFVQFLHHLLDQQSFINCTILK